MGKPMGFLEYDRADGVSVPPLERIKSFHEFHIPLSEKKQRIQGARCMDCGVPFCQSARMIAGMASGCPLNNLCPEWNELIMSGNWKLAYERLDKTNCFPEFTARVCPALCEEACTCDLYGEAVTSKANERAIIEHAWRAGYIKATPPKTRTEKKVAVVGSGPSGLAAAMCLNRRGHKVTVFERNDRIGGLMRYGIPNMKLEKWVIDRRINLMKEEGIEFVTSVDVGVDVYAEQLLKDFNRVLLCCGASNPRDIKVKGRQLAGIYFALDFLRSVTKSLLDSNFADHHYIDPRGKHVVVIGGGDTGNDCVGTSIRLGAKSVTQLEMMPRPPLQRAETNPWPQWPKIEKTDYGQEEAIAVFGHDPRIYQTTVTEYIGDNRGKLKQIEIVDLKQKKDEKTGRMIMAPVEGSGRKIPADLVLIAAGFLGSQNYVTDAFNIKVNSRTNVLTSDNKYETSLPRVFTAGDMHRGQSLVVWAIWEGQQAAKAVDESLMGYTNL
ncbi:glutamate synthase subunit beta [Blautia liquoris]|uniref:Glutamate synthase subunit beta n=1 Tax=Blautia liquoris TaxID=2779518 RepID=A0A7M2RMQ1_9FIRM|nr:glutamate synthase subunit beta [Blautia liquoris]QOV20632.1 glutamate synthase subunit beta [Blautia liquoris]